MFCTIWYHLYNSENVKNTHGEVLLLVKLLLMNRSCFTVILTKLKPGKKNQGTKEKELL